MAYQRETVRSATGVKLLDRHRRTIALTVLLCFITTALFAWMEFNHGDHDETEHIAAECSVCSFIHQLKKSGIAGYAALLVFLCSILAMSLPFATHLLTGFLTPVKLKVRINN